MFTADAANMFQVWTALEVLPLGEPKPFMKEIWMQKLVLSRHPFLWWLFRDILLFQTSFVLF